MTCTVSTLRAVAIAPILVLGLLSAEAGEAAQAIRAERRSSPGRRSSSISAVGSVAMPS